MNYLVKPQSPLMLGENGILPLTSYDQIIMPDGTRWNGANISSDISASQVFFDDGSALNDKTFTHVNRYTLSVSTEAWNTESDGSYTQLIAIEDMLESDYAHVDVDMSSITTDTYADVQDAWALVSRAQTQDGGLLLTCFEGAPEIDLTLKAEVIR